MWFFGISIGGFQAVGVAMDISYGDDSDTGGPISKSVSVFPDLLGLRNGCAQWGPPV